MCTAERSGPAAGQGIPTQMSRPEPKPVARPQRSTAAAARCSSYCPGPGLSSPMGRSPLCECVNYGGRRRCSSGPCALVKPDAALRPKVCLGAHGSTESLPFTHRHG